jgi:hypothetical protein
MTRLLALLFLIAGCDPQATEGEEVFTRTIVVLRGKEAPEVRTEPVIRQKARSGVLSQGITQDGSCGGSSMWLFDQASFYGDELCFFGSGYVGLSAYNTFCGGSPFHCDNWAGTTIQSFWAGQSGGHFDDPSPFYYFQPWASVDHTYALPYWDVTYMYLN